jgi:adenine phosphoribosyltransferase
MSTASDVAVLKGAIRDVPDFPKPGILFKDITPLLKDPSLLRSCAEVLSQACSGRGAGKIVAIESRGFILGSMVADRLGICFVPVRKPGKLPARTVKTSYELEYGTDSLEIHADALEKGEPVIVLDDLLATGGTAQAVGQLVSDLGARVAAYVFLVELGFLEGRARLSDAEVVSLITF